MVCKGGVSGDVCGVAVEGVWREGGGWVNSSLPGGLFSPVHGVFPKCKIHRGQFHKGKIHKR